MYSINNKSPYYEKNRFSPVIISFVRSSFPYPDGMRFSVFTVGRPALEQLPPVQVGVSGVMSSYIFCYRFKCVFVN